MRLIAVLGGLLMLSACGGELERAERDTSPRLPTAPLGEEPRNVGSEPNLGPVNRSSSSGSSTSDGEEETIMVPQPAAASPVSVAPGSLYAIGDGNILYLVDLNTLNVDRIDALGLRYQMEDCDGVVIPWLYGKADAFFNDLVIDARGRLIAGRPKPFAQHLGELTLIDPETADVGEDLFQMPLVPQGMTLTSEGWLAVVGDGLGEVDLESERFVVYLVPPGRFQATGGVVELDGKLLFPIAPAGHATYDLRTKVLETFESSFDRSYQGLVKVGDVAYALLTDGRIVPIDSTGPIGAPVMLQNAWYGATVVPAN